MLGAWSSVLQSIKADAIPVRTIICLAVAMLLIAQLALLLCA